MNVHSVSFCYSCCHGAQSFSRQGVWHLISLKSGTHKNKAISQDVSAQNINRGAEKHPCEGGGDSALNTQGCGEFVLDPPANS